MIARSAPGQEGYNLSPLEPIVTQVTDGAIGAPSYTETHSSTPGVLTIGVTNSNNVKGSGTIQVAAPSSISGTTGGNSFRFSAATAFSINATLTGFNIVTLTAFTSSGNPQKESTSPPFTLPFNLNSIAIDADQLIITQGIRVGVRPPLTSGSTFSSAEVRYDIQFRWRLNPVCVSPPATRPVGSSAAVAVRLAGCESQDLAIDHVEVTQKIQDASNRALLLPGREAIVRVFLKSEGANAKPISTVQGRVTDESGRQLEYYDSSVTVGEALTTAPSNKFSNQELQFLLRNISRDVSRISLTPEVWFLDNSNQKVQEVSSDNNKRSVTVPVAANSTWPQKYAIGLGVICVEGRGCPKLNYKVCVNNCGSKDSFSPEEYGAPDIVRSLPVNNVVAYTVVLPKMTFPESAFADAEKLAETNHRMVVEYIKARQAYTVNADVPDYLVFVAYGNPATDPGGQVLWQAWRYGE